MLHRAAAWLTVLLALTGCVSTGGPDAEIPLAVPAVDIASPLGIGRALLRAGDGAGAERHFQKTLATADPAGEALGWARVHLGDALTLQSRWQEAEQCYAEAAQSLGREGPGAAARARQRWLIAKRSLQGTDPQSARPLLEEALATALLQDDPWLALQVRITTMDLDLVSQDPAASLPELEAALATLEQQAKQEPESYDRAGAANLLLPGTPTGGEAGLRLERLTPEAETLWQGEGTVSDRRELRLTVPAPLLPAGRYRLRVTPPDTEPGSLETVFRFTVTEPSD